MEKNLKKAIILLKSLILHYHGLDDDEKIILEQAAEKWDAHAELEWANHFIASDYLSAFERCKEFLNNSIGKCDPAQKLKYLTEVWEENNRKGYTTEMETTAMINLAKDWRIEHEFLKNIQM